MYVRILQLQIDAREYAGVRCVCLVQAAAQTGLVVETGLQVHAGVRSVCSVQAHRPGLVLRCVWVVLWCGAVLAPARGVVLYSGLWVHEMYVRTKGKR